MAEPNTIQFIEAQLIVALALHERASLRLFLDALEATPLTPTHWGAARGLRDPYGRADLEAFVADRARADLAPNLRRNKPVRYDSHWYTGEHGLSAIHFVTTGPSADEAALVYDAVEQLADALPIELATVDIRFPDQDPSSKMYRSGSVHHLDTFVREGPHTWFPRTILGSRLLALMGSPSALEPSGAEVHALPRSGGLRIDLVAAPWTASPAELKQAQARVDAATPWPSHGD